MAELLDEQIMKKAREAADLYHRLVLVVGPAGSGKTSSLQGIRDRTGAPLLNVNLYLTGQMLELTEQQRSLRLPQHLIDVVNAQDSDMVLLDNIEIVFDPAMRQDPLRLLQRLSRNKTVVATWNGNITDNFLTYAAPTHPEYRRYQLTSDILVASPGQAA